MTNYSLKANVAELLQNTNSFLSPTVYDMVCVKISSIHFTEKVLNSEGVFDWSELNEVLDLGGCTTIHGNFENVISKLGSCMNSVLSTYIKIPPSAFKNKFQNLLSWTHNETLFFYAFELLLTENPLSSVLACLLLTACIERSLGNVYLMKRNTVPYLLKDLLATVELREIFGKDAISLLYILMGTPAALNIRNILWHGFISPSELDKKYGFFLIAVASSLGKKLNASGIKSSEIPCRAYISMECVEDFRDIFFDLGMEELQFLGKSVASMLHTYFATYWKGVIELYASERYGDSLSLVVPLLESILRLIFVCANDRPQHVMTAEPEAHYITLTEVFSEKLDDGSMNLFAVNFSENEMELLLDIFVYPDGPRIRDRLSHGEINLQNVPKDLVKHMIYLCSIVSFKCGIIIPNESKFTTILENCATIYESIYHPCSLLKQQVYKLLSGLKDWVAYPVVVPDLHNDGGLELCFIPAGQCVFLACKIHNHFKVFNRWHSFEEGLEEYKALIASCRMHVLHLQNLSLELTTLLRKIVDNSSESSENIKQALNIFYIRWSEKSLRSRQRQTYKRLLKSVPALYSSIRVILVLMICYMYDINYIGAWTEEDFKACIKFLKGVLKYVENLTIMTKIQINKWQEAFESAKNFIMRTHSHLVFAESNSKHI